MKKLLTIIFAVCLFAIGTSNAAITGTLSPDSVVGTHNPDETKSYTLNYSIDITGGASGDVDVLFLTDTTGSMGGYIGSIKTAFGGVLTALNTAYGSSLNMNYGVSDYRNYYDGGSYTTNGIRLRQSFTSDTVAVQTAINTYAASGGGDGPESQLKAMEILSANWLNAAGAGTNVDTLNFGGRSTAQKILVWAGDYYGHIEGDAGPPADYYPTVQETVDALNAEGIVTFGLNVYGQTDSWALNGTYGVPAGTPQLGQQDYITSNTGGQSFYSVGTGGPTVEDAIVAAISGGVETLTNITLSLDGNDDPFDVSPWSQTITGTWTAGTVTGSFTFDAKGYLAGDKAFFDMVLLGNGAELDRSAVELTVVPIPGAFLLGILGLSAAGLRIRKFA